MRDRLSLTAPVAMSAAVLSTMLAVTSCTGDSEPAPVPVALGTVYNLSGSQAVLDRPSSNGSALAAAQINRRGGVVGRELTLVPVVGDSDVSSLAGRVADALAGHPGIVALLGLSDTDNVLAAAPVAAAAGRVFLTSGATSPELPAQVPEYLFLACFGDNVQAAAGAEWAWEDLGARSVHVLFDPDESYPRLLQGYFVERFEGLGGSVSAVDSIHPRADDVELPAIGDVDLVYLSVETAEDAARVLPVLRGAGYDGAVLGGDGYDAESVWSVAPDVSDVYFTTHVYLGDDHPDRRVGDFLAAYRAAYPGEEPSAFAALGYDAVGLLAAAIEVAGDTAPDAVRTALSGLEDYAGVTGTISFSDGSRIPTKSVSLLKVEGGRQEFVTEILPTSVPAP